VVHFCILYCNVRKVPPARLPMDHIATYYQKNAQHIWLCASYTVSVSLPTPPHTPIMCIVSYIQSSAIWHTEIVYPELLSFHEFFFLFCFVLSMYCLLSWEYTFLVYHACQAIRFTFSHPRYHEVCLFFCSPWIKVGGGGWNYRFDENRIFHNFT
jgi:hypothetical protein